MAQAVKIQYKFEPHIFNQKICHWAVCQYCGLVALRNEVTARAIKLGCNWKDK